MRKKLLKRTAAVAISAAMLFSTAPMTTAFAANGPMGEYTTEWGETLHLAWITFNDYQLDENGKIVNDQYGWGNVTSKYNVYAEEKTDNEALAGATYDKATNTLTLNNLKNKSLQLVTNVMGDDFTINVVGDCELMEIRIWGDSHGGSLKITGDGTLTVNSYKNYDAAITLYAENTDATLNFDESVNVKLYGKEKAAAIIGSLHTDTKTGITFANGQSTDAVKAEKYSYEVREMVETIEIGDSKWKEGDLAASEDDPDGIYAIATYWYVDDDNNPTSDTLHSVKEFVYDEQRGVYLQDTGFGTLNDLTDEELKNSKFSFIYDTENYGKEIAYHNADTPAQNEYSSYYTIYQVNVPDDPQGVYGTSGHLEGKYINSSTIYHLAKDEQTEEYYEDKELDYTENSLNRSEFLASDFAYVYDESEKPVSVSVKTIDGYNATVYLMTRESEPDAYYGIYRYYLPDTDTSTTLYRLVYVQEDILPI